MAKSKVTAESFLKGMGLGVPEQVPAALVTPVSGSPAENDRKTKSGVNRSSGRTGLKHIGGYLDRDTVEKVALLRARLGLDNSQLMKQAIEELYSREMAARKFGER